MLILQLFCIEYNIINCCILLLKIVMEIVLFACVCTRSCPGEVKGAQMRTSTPQKSEMECTKNCVWKKIRPMFVDEEW